MRSAASRSLESDRFQSINHGKRIIQTLVSIVKTTYLHIIALAAQCLCLLSLDLMQIVPDATYIAFYMIAARPGTPGAPPQQSVTLLLL